MEGYGAEFEADANDQEDQTEDQDLVVHALLGHDLPGNGADLDGAGGAVDHGGTVEQHPGAQGTEDKVLHGRL